MQMTIPVRWGMDDPVCDAYRVNNSVSSELHGHSHFLINLIARGTGIQTVNGKDMPFTQGDIFLLSPADFHRNKMEDGHDYDYYGVKFNFDTIDHNLTELFPLDALPIRISLSDTSFQKISAVILELIAETSRDQKSIADKVYVKALLEQLVILIMRQFPEKHEKAADPFAVRMLSYLYTNFHRPITVTDAAAFIGYTPNYFNNVFHTAFGLPFGAYLRKMRLEYAKNLLLSYDIPITAIALESGFGSLTHFSKCFKAAFGVSPQQFRMQNT